MCSHAVSVVVTPRPNELHEVVDAVQVLLDRDVLVCHVRLGDGAGTKDNRGNSALVHKVPNVTTERARADAGGAASARKYLAHIHGKGDLRALLRASSVVQELLTRRMRAKEIVLLVGFDGRFA